MSDPHEYTQDTYTEEDYLRSHGEGYRAGLRDAVDLCRKQAGEHRTALAIYGGGKEAAHAWLAVDLCADKLNEILTRLQDAADKPIRDAMEAQRQAREAKRAQNPYGGVGRELT